MFTKFASFRVAALVVIVLCFTTAVIFKSGPASKANNYPAAFVPIIGATKIPHLKELFAAVDITLSAEEIHAVEEPYQPHPILGHEQPSGTRMLRR